MLGWLERLSPRELALVGATVVLGSAALIYLWLIEPLYQGRIRAADEVIEARETARFLETQRRANAQLLVGGAAPARAAASAAPRSLAALETELRGTELATALERMAPQPDDRVELSFDAVSYAALMGWLVQTGLDRRVQELSIIASDVPDRVSATLTVDLGAMPE